MDDAAVFGNTINRYLRSTGYSQKHLADALGLHPKVFSRKLCGSSNAHLTQLEVKRIIMKLIHWNIVTSQEEVLHLLELAGLKRSSFSPQEWDTPPLSELKSEYAQDSPLHVFDPLPRCHHHNLPAPATRLIGRAWAVDRLQVLLGSEGVRLITLTGTGGSGKTRLALHVANASTGLFPHGVCFVELAEITDSSHVSASIMRALDIPSVHGVPPIKSLIEYLWDKQLLILLDNFEQVIDAAPLVGELLAGAPCLKILVTSRAVLHLYGEHEFNVPPLVVPDLSVNPQDATALAQNAAVQLFVERAQAVLCDFSLNPHNCLIVAQICTMLDGLPLALELAATRLKLLPLELLQEVIETSRFSLLSGGARNLPKRQQTLCGAIAWSYDLLDTSEQILFRRLSVFPAGWTLEAVEAICFDGVARGKTRISTIDDLTSLLDKSLLMVVNQAGAGLRFVMLQSVREYALKQLHEHGEAQAIQRSHALYYLEYAGRAERGRCGERGGDALECLEQEQENIREALQWFMTHLAGSVSVQGALERIAALARQGLELFQKLNDAQSITLASNLLNDVARAQSNALLIEGVLS